MYSRKRGSHARGFYPKQDTSRMRTARMKQEGKSRDKNNSERVVRNMEDRNVGVKRKSFRQGLTSAEDLTIMRCIFTSIISKQDAKTYLNVRESTTA